MKPYTCIVNDLALLKNLLRKIANHQTCIISANINYRQAISFNTSIIVICINLLINLQAIFCGAHLQYVRDCLSLS